MNCFARLVGWWRVHRIYSKRQGARLLWVSFSAKCRLLWVSFSAKCRLLGGAEVGRRSTAVMWLLQLCLGSKGVLDIQGNLSRTLVHHYDVQRPGGSNGVLDFQGNLSRTLATTTTFNDQDRLGGARFPGSDTND